jgi:putative ABC transport system substrate-binding protein
VYRIGFLGGGSPSGYAPHVEALRLGLREHGYVEGKNLTIEYRWAEGKYDRLPGLATELVRLRVDCIVTQGTPAALTAKKTTTTVPIVMAIVGNPDETGIVANLARPGGNITGSSFFYAEVNAKRLEVLKAAFPTVARIGVLLNPDNPAMVSVLRAMEDRAQALTVRLWHMEVRRLEELDGAFVKAKTQVEAVTVIDEGLFIANRDRVAGLAEKSRLPSIGFSEYGAAGGLLAYGVNFPHIWRQSMVLVDKIFKGANPGDLPIQQATRFDLVINLKTAKALGLTVPPSLLQRADQVIE